jgi:hypothetical protein
MMQLKHSFDVYVFDLHVGRMKKKFLLLLDLVGSLSRFNSKVEEKSVIGVNKLVISKLNVRR